MLCPGNASEVQSVEPLVEELPTGKFIADRAYDSKRLRGLLVDQCEVVIPSTRSRKVPIPHDRIAYKARHLVENAFADLKQFRGVANCCLLVC